MRAGQVPWITAGRTRPPPSRSCWTRQWRQYPHLFTAGPALADGQELSGTARIARLIARTHVLIRLKSDIPLRRISQILADGSYLAELSGDGVTMTVRVIEYFIDVEGQDVPEMFCLVTDLTDIAEYPGPELAALYSGGGTGRRPRSARPRPRCAARAGNRADAPLRQARAWSGRNSPPGPPAPR